ncbi:hypothetical protein F5880DRAFT_1560595 [Lentinula raphanica]|nr:hypothetical protein F5880DRAFT_1560595 [Lentinula raphanica]
MNLSRSKTSRSKSRSPAPPISQPSPQYYPPSHYAAAGGFSLPVDDRVEQLDSNYSGEPSSQDAYFPVSYLSSTSSDPSSFDSNDNHPTQSRSRKSSVDSFRKKRESQIHNLPLVEAQLLPSLRDTINKMTRPPSRVAASSNSNTPTITLSRQTGSEEYTSSGGSIDASPFPPPSPRLKPPSTRMPTAGEDRPTTPSRIMTPKSGSALKSALKAPTPKISSYASPTPTSASSPGGGALRSVRSLLRRKSSSSTATASSVSDDQAAKENHLTSSSFDVSRQINPRSRSRTDPGTFVPVKEQSNILSAQSNQFTSSKIHQTAHTSHIPRFRGVGSTSESARQFAKSHYNAANASTDESDLEYRYEVEGRDRRKLTVTNAVVVPSSSSESEDDPSFHLHFHTSSHPQRLPGRPKPTQGAEGNIGLGLMLMDKRGLQHDAVQHQEDYNEHESDQVRIYHEEHHYEHVGVHTDPRSGTYAVPQRQSRSSMMSYPSAGSIYSTDDSEETEFSDASGSGNGREFACSNDQSVSLNELDQTHNRRKAALLGLVQGLDNMSIRSEDSANRAMAYAGLAAETSSGRSILSEGESDYCGEKGLAVSGSLGEGNGLDDGHQESASESDYEFEGIWVASAPSTPRTPAAPRLTAPDVVTPSLRASRYASPSQSNSASYTRGSHTRDPNPERVPLSKSSRRQSLHPSSAISPSSSPVPAGRYNHLSPSTKDKAKNLTESPRSKANINEKEQRVVSKRKSFVRDSSPSAANHSSPSTPSLPPPSPATPSHRRLSPTPSSTVKRESSNTYESVVLAKRSMEALVRTRQAFGIPPSDSDAIYRSPAPNYDQNPNQEHDDQNTNSTTLPPADSVSSGVDVQASQWEQVEDNELSVGAENLFRTLSEGGQSSGEGRGRSHRGHEERRGQRYEQQQRQYNLVTAGDVRSERTDKSKSRERRQSRRRSRTPTARATSTQRATEKDKSDNPSVPSSWRSLVGLERYRSFLDSYGELELQRQEVIWDLSTAETVFVDRLSCVVNLFIIPLRVHTTKTWISGVPLEIAKVLDWLEDIINLHTQIRDTLQSFQTPESPFAGSQTKGHDEVAVAYALCACVHKLEIYQPYLVKLSGVLEMLHRLVKDGGSDFGEFVRMQEKSQECRMSFADMLQEPANRIVAYPALFRKLLEVTPKNHEEYLPTFILVHSATLVVKTLQTVKEREEEYELVKSISERIDGLPASTVLARRDRRLLCQGQLLCLSSDQFLSGNSRDSKDSRWSSNAKPSDPSNRSSRLVDAINDWDTRRSRSGSVKSNNSSSTGISFRSVETSSPPPPPQLTVLVFSDLIVLASPRSTLRDNSSHQEQQSFERWTLCEDLGLARVLGVEEANDNGHDANGYSLMSVDLLPLEYDLNQVSSCLGTRVKTLHFQLPFNTISSNPSRESWISAFQRSSQATMRNLSHPGGSKPNGDLEGPNQLLEQDRRRILESILQTGLPFPKSPSLQLTDEMTLARGGNVADNVQMEREERGWWSLQFQQSLRESWYNHAAS